MSDVFMRISEYAFGEVPLLHMPAENAGLITPQSTLHDVVSARMSAPHCMQLRDLAIQSALNPEGALYREISGIVQHAPDMSNAPTASQLAAQCKLAVSSNNEVTLDLLRDTGLPLAIAEDLIRRLAAEGPGFDIGTVMQDTPTLDRWALSVLDRTQPATVTSDVLTLRILQAFAQDVAIPCVFVEGSQQVRFSLCSEGDQPVRSLIDLAVAIETTGHQQREVCRNAYEAMCVTHHCTGEDQLWPQWKRCTGFCWTNGLANANGPRNDFYLDANIDSETALWIRRIDPIGSR
jgi:hypothetical protein